MSNKDKIAPLKNKLKEIYNSISKSNSKIEDIRKEIGFFYSQEFEISREIESICDHTDGEYVDDFQSFDAERVICCISCNKHVRTENKYTGEVLFSHEKK